jgi:hypothetical protein
MRYVFFLFFSYSLFNLHFAWLYDTAHTHLEGRAHLHNPNSSVSLLFHTMVTPSPDRNSLTNPCHQLLKLEWHRLTRERQQAKEAEAAHYLGGALMDDADEEELQMMQQQYARHQDMDALMADAIAQQEQADVDALVSALEEEGRWDGYGLDELQQQQQQFSDDEDYDGLFMDLIQQQQQQQEGMGGEEDVEMS